MDQQEGPISQTAIIVMVPKPRVGRVEQHVEARRSTGIMSATKASRRGLPRRVKRSLISRSPVLDASTSGRR